MRRGEQGFALVAVLAAVAVAAVLAAAALTLARGSVAGSELYVAEMEGGHAATAAIRLAAIRLADSEGYDLGQVAGEQLDWNGWRVTVRVEDEATKLDLNRGSRRQVANALAAMGVARGGTVRAMPAIRRLVTVDELAGALDLPTGALPALRRRFTIYGAEAPQPAGIRSALETYRIVAEARGRGRRIVRWAIVRLSVGFGEPFEWLEHGSEAADVTRPSRRLLEN